MDETEFAWNELYLGGGYGNTANIAQLLEDGSHFLDAVIFSEPGTYHSVDPLQFDGTSFAPWTDDQQYDYQDSQGNAHGYGQDYGLEAATASYYDDAFYNTPLAVEEGEPGLSL